MRLSELSQRTQVPPATVKYYLREGLLPPGVPVSATRAEYGDEHVERLRLIRALVTGAGVSVSGVRRIVAALEDPPTSWHDFLGAAQDAITDAPPGEVSDTTRYAVTRLGWRVEGDCAALLLLQSALETAEHASFPLTTEQVVDYGRAMQRVAEIDLEGLGADTAGGSPSDALRHVAVGTVVVDPVLVALRRLAQAALSAQRFAEPGLPSESQPGRRPGV